MKNKNITYTLAVLLTVVFSAVSVSAQPGGPAGGTPGGGPPPTTTGAPIDGGATALVLAVAGYAALQLKRKKETKESV